MLALRDGLEDGEARRWRGLVDDLGDVNVERVGAGRGRDDPAHSPALAVDDLDPLTREHPHDPHRMARLGPAKDEGRPDLRTGEVGRRGLEDRGGHRWENASFRREKMPPVAS